MCEAGLSGCGGWVKVGVNTQKDDLVLPGIPTVLLAFSWLPTQAIANLYAKLVFAVMNQRPSSWE